MMLAYTNGCESYIPMDRDLRWVDMRQPPSRRMEQPSDTGTVELFIQGLRSKLVAGLRSLWE